MKYNLLVFVLATLIFNAYGGQLSGDPAPGRSPGPPPQDNFNDNANSINQTNQIILPTAQAINASFQALNNINEIIQHNTNTNNDNRNNISNRISELTTNEVLINNNKRKEFNNIKSHGIPHHRPTDEQIQKITASTIPSTERAPINTSHSNSVNGTKLAKNVITVATATITSESPSTSASSINASPNLDKLTNEFIKQSETSFRSNHKPCKNLSVNEYLLMKTHSSKIVKVDRSLFNTTTIATTTAVAAAAATVIKAETINVLSPTSTGHRYHHPIRIDVTHDVFDAKFGLVKNIVYTGM